MIHEDGAFGSKNWKREHSLFQLIIFINKTVSIGVIPIDTVLLFIKFFHLNIFPLILLILQLLLFDYMSVHMTAYIHHHNHYLLLFSELELFFYQFVLEIFLYLHIAY